MSPYYAIYFFSEDMRHICLFISDLLILPIYFSFKMAVYMVDIQPFKSLNFAMSKIGKRTCINSSSVTNKLYYEK